MTNTTDKRKGRLPSTGGMLARLAGAGVICSVLILGAVALMGATRDSSVYAQSSSATISGWAWSDTIGWISFNDSGYDVSVAANGTLSGYAWSENIGWISANSADLAGCPNAPCTARIDEGGTLHGWLRALSGGTSQSGGWDGFISLSGANYGPARQSNGSFSGYAWGSDVVGWVDFSYASTNYEAQPTADLKVRRVGDDDWYDGLTIDMLEEIELGWNQNGTDNTVSCQAVPPLHGFSTGGAVSGIDSDVEEPIGHQSFTYGLLCYGDSSTQNFDTVTVSTIGGEGANFCNSYDFVRRGSNLSLCYELGTNEPSLCSIRAGASTVASPLPSIAGTATYQNIIGEVTFTLECIGGDSDTMTVKVLPEVQET